ncbi:MAG TPA: hypothetical protein VLU94_01640 [Candidatus Nitrosotalea sp.]|nr:hypothetical protein [Candidatus Nitrosotalea sp.]
MKDAIKQWMTQTPRVRGVLAYGVRFTDKTSINETYSRDFPIVALENTWRCIADAYQVLTLHRFPVARMQWIYENAVLTCVRRNDGIILGLFVTPNRRELDSKELERQLTEFQSIRKSAG